MSPSLVVAGAIVRHGRILAARRSSPIEAAGRWELPGGKVEPGETPELALARELSEELGCTVAVGEALPGDVDLPDGSALRTYLCRLIEGEPEPIEHDAVRWLGPEELDEVDWLPADVSFVEQLPSRLLDGERLPGGNVGGAVRIGATVRRPTGRWTPAVHALLRHLADGGLDAVPTVLGTDARGREVLTYVPGRVVGHDDEPLPDAQVTQIGAWLRRFHTTVADFEPPADASWRNTDRALAPGQIICHHDIAPYNVVMHDDTVVCVIDWDMAGPGRPIEDLAFCAWTAVPFYRDVGSAEAVRRLRLLCDAYGMNAAPVLRAVVPRMRGATAKIAAGQAAGDPGMLNLLQVGEPARSLAGIAGLRQRLPGLEAALSQGPL